MDKKRKYRRFVLFCLALDLVILGIFGIRYLERKIPDEIYVDDISKLDLKKEINCPFVHFEDAIPVSAGDGYKISCSIGNVIPFKEVKVIPSKREYVYASGSVIGIYMETEGVLVIDSGEIMQSDGTVKTPAKDVIKAGDYIVAFNEETIHNKKELMQQLSTLSSDVVTLQVRRGEKILPLSIRPVKDAGDDYKLGIWVRDDTQGVGTLTYVDAQGKYGALGHGISDVDTGNLLEIHSGRLYGAQILAINKGTVGNPGELAGLIRYENKNILGTIDKNLSSGIFGSLKNVDDEKIELKKMPIAYKQEINVGTATVLCTIDEKVQEFDVEIERVDLNHEDSNKGFVLKITDNELLEKTGGIVQGLSGSPVIQNGRIVGAVTHVLVNDPTRGYGIFIENMLDAAG